MRTDPCPICGTSRPARWAGEEPWICSVSCYRDYFERCYPPTAPLCHDTVTTTCPSCQRPFSPVGRQRYCSGACRAAAYRRRRDDTNRPAARVPSRLPGRPVTVYECGACGYRSIGEQRCPDCSIFMGKVGLGGECPACSEPVAVNELLPKEVIAAD